MAKITFLGHASVLLEDGGHSVIFDPWLSGNPVAKTKPEEINVDAVLVSHGHFDHVVDAAGISQQSDAPIIGTAEMAGYFESKGLKAHGMHIGGSHQFSFGWVKLTPAWHGSAISEQDGTQVYTGSPCGFLVKLGDKLVYHSGDTGLFGDMKLIGELNDIDVALLPIGDNYVMGPQDAAIAASWLGAKVIIPIHYNTFELLQQDPEEFKRLVEEKNGGSVQALQPGESIEF